MGPKRTKAEKALGSRFDVRQFHSQVLDTGSVPMAVLENKAGKYVVATTESGQAALASVPVPDDMIVWAADPDVPEAYPIVTYTWLISYKKYPDPNKLRAMQDLIRYGLSEGQKDAEALGFIPLPAAVVAKATMALDHLASE